LQDRFDEKSRKQEKLLEPCLQPDLPERNSGCHGMSFTLRGGCALYILGTRIIVQVDAELMQNYMSSVDRVSSKHPGWSLSVAGHHQRSYGAWWERAPSSGTVLWRLRPTHLRSFWD
jgi:hypothetical protein